MSCPNRQIAAMMFAHSPPPPGVRCEASSSRSATHADVARSCAANVTDLVPSPPPRSRPGATGLTLVNSVMGMVIDVEACRPQFDGVAADSGRADHAHPLAAVCETSHVALPDCRSLVRVVWRHGVSSTIEMMQAGRRARCRCRHRDLRRTAGRAADLREMEDGAGEPRGGRARIDRSG